MSSHNTWPRVMCVSWIRGVILLGTRKRTSVRPFILPPLSAGKADGEQSLRARYIHGFENVWGVAAGRDANRDIAGVAERLNLAGKHRVVAIVVAESCQGGSIGGKGKSRAAVSDPE